MDEKKIKNELLKNLITLTYQHSSKKKYYDSKKEGTFVSDHYAGERII